MEGVNVCGQRLARGVRVILLVEGDVVLCDLSHVGPGMVGSSVRCMSVPALEDLLFPAEVYISKTVTGLLQSSLLPSLLTARSPV